MMACPCCPPTATRSRAGVTAPDVLRAIARQITGGQPGTAHAQLAADWDDADPDSARQHPPTPLPGYQLVEITIAGDSPASSRKLGEVTWPPASTPVSILRGRHLRPPDPQLTLAPGDRVRLLTVTPGHSSVPDPAEPDDIRPAGSGTGSRA